MRARLFVFFFNLTSSKQIFELCVLDSFYLMIVDLPGFFKVKKSILLREAILHFSYCLLTHWESTLEGKNLLLKEQILSFKSRFLFGTAFLYREAIRKI